MKTIKTKMFTQPNVEEELTKESIKEIIAGQEIEIENLKREIKNKQDCIKHYQQYLK